MCYLVPIKSVREGRLHFCCTRWILAPQLRIKAQSMIVTTELTLQMLAGHSYLSLILTTYRRNLVLASRSEPNKCSFSVVRQQVASHSI